MDLSRNIIKRYVAVATPEKITSNSETVYGTVVSEGEELFVMIDGSSILTPVSSNIDLAEGDRVLVLVKNHEATVIGSPTSPTARLEELRALEEGVSEFEVILADKVGTGELVAMQALIEDLEAKDVEISGKLTANEAKVEALEVENETINGKLTAYQADIEELQADNVTVTETLTAHKADIDSLQADNATITDTLTAHKAVIDNLDATYATIDQLDVEKGRINNLEAGVAEIGELAATHATIEQLDTEKARITNLEADVGDIDTLIFGSASGTTIQTSFANAVIAQLGNAQIKSAMIESLSADKLTAGDIITNNVRVLSEDGKLLISDETIQISDDTRVRVQIGKDASGDYSISIWDADGNLMFSEGGITDSAIKNAIIRDDMVSENANIAASKLDISSLFTEINNSTQTINANRVLIDTDSGTLDVAFTQMSSDVDDLSGSVESQGTKLNVIQGQIDSKVWQQDIDNATGELETQYSELSQTVDGISATVAQHTTDISAKADSSTVTAVTDRVTAVEADLSGFKTTVSETYVDSDSFEDLETAVNQNSTSIASLVSRTTAVEDKFGDYSTTEEMTSAIEQKAESITSSVSATYATKTALATTDTKATNAATAASNAQTTANTAKTNAATAQSAAEAAQQAADDAQDDVDALTTRVSTAETKIEQNSDAIALRATKTELTAVSNAASAAQSTADTAKANAATAQSTADTAKTNAATAQTTANNAATAASNAQSTADDAQDTADAAQSTANTANSTANSVKTDLANNYYTKTETEAKIKVSADSITSSVSSTYATKSALSATDTKAENAATAASNAQTTANTAQSAADAAQADIDGLEVGGRNLLYGDGLFVLSSNNTSLYPITCDRTEEGGISFFRVKRTDSSLNPNTLSLYNSISKTKFNYAEMLGQQVTLSFKARASRNITATFMNYAYQSDGTKTEFGKQAETITTAWSTFYVTVDEFPAIEDGGGVRWCPYMLSLTNDEFDTFYLDVRDWKFERGNKATDWTPAPEDVDGDITNAQATADKAVGDNAAAEERLTAAESVIEQLSTCISMLVVDGSGASLMTQTDDGWQFSIGSIQDSVNRTSSDLNDLTDTVGNVENTVGVLESAVADLGALAEYVRIGTYDNEETGNTEPCIELGETDSDFKLLITNTRILFMDGSGTPTYIKDNTLMTNSVEVNSELRQTNPSVSGSWVWAVRPNGNYGLVWKGADA